MIYLLSLCEEPAILRLFLLINYVIRIVCILLPLLVFFMFVKTCIKHVIDGESISKSFGSMFKSLAAALIIFFIPTICTAFFNLVEGYVDIESEFSKCFTNVDIEFIRDLEKENLENSKEDVNDLSEIDKKDPVLLWPDTNDNNDSNGTSSNSNGNTTNLDGSDGGSSNTSSNMGTGSNSGSVNNSNSVNDVNNGGSPGSSNSNLKSATKNIIIGDSRTVGMCATISGDWTNCQYSNGGSFIYGDDIYIAQGSMGYTWFNGTAINAVNSLINAYPDVTFNIYSLMGVNFLLYDIDKYIPKYIELANGAWKNHNLILVSVNPVDEVKEAQNGYSTKQADIITFNNKLKNGTAGVANIKYCDTYNSVISSLQTSDGLHYASSTYNAIYSSMKSCGN